MTKQSETARKARQWDRDINEGGEGYNPYREEKAGTLSLAARKQHLQQELLTLDSATVREAGISKADREAQIKAEIAEIEAQIEANDNAKLVAAGWTPEVTLARRDEWNGIVKSGAIKTLDDKCSLQTRLGWTHDDLKAALAYHRAQGNIE